MKLSLSVSLDSELKATSEQLFFSNDVIYFSNIQNILLVYPGVITYSRCCLKKQWLQLVSDFS